MEAKRYDFDRWLADQIEWVEKPWMLQQVLVEPQRDLEAYLASGEVSRPTVAVSGGNMEQVGRWYEMVGARRGVW